MTTFLIHPPNVSYSCKPKPNWLGITGVHVVLYLYQNITSALDWMERLLKLVTSKVSPLSSRLKYVLYLVSSHALSALEFIKYWIDHRWNNFAENSIFLQWLSSARDTITDQRLKLTCDGVRFLLLHLTCVKIVDYVAKRDQISRLEEESSATDEASSPRNFEDCGISKC